MVRVSVIIPCYNQGHFLEESLNSVATQTFQDFEIIVVNDGSTDKSSQHILKNLDREKVRVIHQENMGLAGARNTGIEHGRGEYVLPLDADDRIEPEYLEKAVQILDSMPKVGIVYCRAQLFGAVETEWQLPDYSLQEMLKENLIFCSALFRRSDWKSVGGYDTGMVYGWEDYEFWLSLIERGREVYRLPDILFCYRVASDSMVRSKEKWQKIAMFKRIYQRHTALFHDNIEVWIEAVLDTGKNYYTSRLYVDCGEGISDDTSLVRKVEQTTPELLFDLKTFGNIQALRFDPVDVPAVVEILSIHLIYEDGRQKKVDRCTDNALFCIGSDRFFATGDPQFFLELEPPTFEGLIGLSIRLSFKSLGDEALSRIVKIQQDRIDSQTELELMVPKNDQGAVGAFCSSLRKKTSESVAEYLKRQLRLF